MRVGVVDNQQPWWMPDLVPAIDELGYSRYWATEHHGSTQSASPIVMAALAAGISERLRVGTAGVILAFHSPLRVAQEFRLLQLMYPGRLDLGLVNGNILEPHRGLLLEGRPAVDQEGYAAKVRRLVRLVRGETGEDGDVAPNTLGPRCEGTPELWLCGSSRGSALLAARLGVSYSFHDYLNTCHAPEPDLAAERGPAIVGSYLEGFVPGPHQAAPRFNVACYGICAERSELARELWAAKHRLQVQRQGASALPRASFCGEPEECRRQLQAIQRRYGAEELIIQCLTDDRSACLRSYALLAEALDLPSGRREARAAGDGIQVKTPQRSR